MILKIVYLMLQVNQSSSFIAQIVFFSVKKVNVTKLLSKSNIAENCLALILAFLMDHLNEMAKIGNNTTRL